MATGQVIAIAENEVEAERRQAVSVMPRGLVANFSPQQLPDLIECLLTLRQGDAVNVTIQPE